MSRACNAKNQIHEMFQEFKKKIASPSSMQTLAGNGKQADKTASY